MAEPVAADQRNDTPAQQRPVTGRPGSQPARAPPWARMGETPDHQNIENQKDRLNRSGAHPRR